VTDRVWTKQNIEAVRKLASTGLYAKQISAKFPWATKNAIISICRRNNILLQRTGGGGFKSIKKSATIARERAKPVKAIVVAPKPENAPTVKFEPRGMLFAKTRNSYGECRFIYAQDRLGQYTCCGKPTGENQAFCPEHKSLCVVPVNPNRMHNNYFINRGAR
jgi:hypothetical protein